MNEWHYDTARDLELPPNRRHCSPLRESDLKASVLRLGWLVILRAVLRFWNGLEIQGLNNLPTGPPFVMVANHCSHLDALVLASALSLRWRDQISPLAAGDYFFAAPPVAGFSALVLNALPVWRNRLRGQLHELAGLRARLIEQQAIYIVFPEGSRSRDGQLHAFKPGFATLVAGTTVPVLPCHVSGSFAAMPPDQHALRPRKIRLQLGAPMTFEHVANRAEGWRHIAALTREAILGLPACKIPARRFPARPWHERLLLTARFAGLLLRRQLRGLAHPRSAD